MAIAFAQVKVHTRSKGHSAVAGAAYRSGTALMDERTGVLHDFTKRSDVAYQNLMLPEGVNEQFQDREFLWNQVEFVEDRSTQRKRAQVAKDIMLALPRELGLNQQIELARNFAYDHYVRHGLVADVAIHDHGDGNPHAHIYVSTRRLQETQFDHKKARDLNPSFANWKGGKGFINENDYVGKQWRDYQNTYFKAHDLDLEVDENYLIPQRHEGRVRGSQAHYLHEENQLRKAACEELSLTSPEAVLNHLGRLHAVFSDRDIDRLLGKNIQSVNDQALAKEALSAHQDFVHLGTAADGRERYTTRANYQLESELADNAAALLSAQHKRISNRHINRASAQYGLNSEQADALYHIATAGGISAIVGRAGTGKSYLMKAARDLWEGSGLHVQGMAVSGVAAKGLEEASGIRSKTIAHYKQLIQHDAWHLNRDSVVVMDEAGMTDLHDMADIIRHVKQAGAKLVLVGDHAQLQPVGKGAPFRALVERIGFAEMNQIQRQTSIKDQFATAQLAKGDVSAALQHYDKQNQVHFYNQYEVTDAIIEHWQAGLKNAPLKEQMILAFKNEDVRTLNTHARASLKTHQMLANKDHVLSAHDGEIPVAKGERLLFLKNNKALGVHNGDFATVTSIRGDRVHVTLDNDQRVSFSTNEYQNFTHGYASTVHKAQGATRDNVFVYVSGPWNRFLSYVALSRHRHCVQIYAHNEEYKSIDALSKNMSRDSIKDSVLDFPISFAIRRGYDPESLVGRFVEKTAKIKSAIQDKWLYLRNYDAYLSMKVHREKIHDASVQRDHARLVAEFVDLHRSQGKEWSEITRSTQAGLIERESLYQHENYQLLVEQTHYKNALAAQIHASPDQYQEALRLNNISGDVVAKAAERYSREVHAKAFVQAYQSGRLMHQHQLAPEIMANTKAYYAAIATQAGIQSEPVARVMSAARTAAIDGTYYQLLMSAGSKESAAQIKAVYEYAKLDQQIKSRWAQVYRHGGVDRLSTAQLAQYHQASIKADRLGAALYKDMAMYSKTLEQFHINVNDLEPLYTRHQLRETVSDYSTLSKTHAREKLAADIISDRRYYRHVFEHQVSWQQLYRDKQDLKNRLKLQSLTASERPFYQDILDYQGARVAVAKAWSEMLSTKQSGQTVSKETQAAVWTLVTERNRLAYRMIQQPSDYQNLLSASNLKIDDLKKHALAYRSHLIKQHASQSHVDKQPSRTKKQDTANKTTAFDQQTGHWRYESVSAALDLLGEEFYNRVLGFEGKREGAHHLRYGQGHALVYAHSGSKAGSWHSFSSGEGGGPIQLLMSSHHGWGLSYDQALEEGAKIAGLSHEQIITPRKPVAPIKLQQLTDNREAKISRARYYYLSAQPIKGTLGERYLREHRGIQGRIDDVRFHPHIRDVFIDPETGKKHVSYHPGIVLAARNEQGEITGTQTILLDAQSANKVQTARVGAVKRSRGEIKGSAVQVQSGKSNQVIFVEGVETALSLLEAAPDANIYVTLGNIKNAESLAWIAKKHQATEVHFAADFDPQTTHQNVKAIHDIANTFKYEHNLDTYVSQPSLGTAEKCDFNDILVKRGKGAVNNQLNAWGKITVPERETIIEKDTISQNAQTLGKSLNADKPEKNKDNERATKLIDQYLHLLRNKKQAKTEREVSSISVSLDRIAVSICEDKPLFKTINAHNAKVGRAIHARAKIAISKSKDQDIDR